MTTTFRVFLFTDLVGSTEAAERAGHQAYERYRQGHFAAMREAIAAHAGSEVKTVGDAFMAAFDGAGDAVACAIAMQQAQARLNRRSIATGLRVGISAGDATKDGGDYFGMPVVEASRLCVVAAGGQVLVSEVVRLLDRSGAHRFQPAGTFELKGISAPVAASEVVYALEEGEPLLARAPFVGREAERAALLRLLEEARRGRGALAMIGGEPGVGKTRLAEEVMAEARAAGMFAAIGHCYEMEGAPPYIPFVEAIEHTMRVVPRANLGEALGESASEVARLVPELRRLFPEMQPAIVMPPEEGRRYLYNNVRDYLGRAARTQPMLLVLDDLHWADDSTLLLLEHVAQRLSETPLLVIGTYRDVELEVGRPLARTLEGLNRRGLVERVSLRRFPKPETAAMLRGLSGREPPPSLVEVVHAETEGVPFFIQEVYRHLSEEGRLFDASGQWRSDVRLGEVEVPEGVRLVIGRRLERVGEETRRVLTAASVIGIGRAFTYELLQALAGVSEDALLDAVDEAERAHLIVTGEGRDTRITFAHEQIRQTLLGSMSLPRRQRLHLRVAVALERAYAGHLEQRASDLAHHLYQAGAAADTGRTVHYLAVAGDQALGAAAFEDGLRLFENALSLLPGEDRRGRARLLFKKGLVRRSLGPWDLGEWREALDLHQQVGDGQAVARTCHEMAASLSLAARLDETLEMAQRGLAALGDAASPERCLLLAIAAVALSFGPPGSADYNAAEQMFREALAMSRELGDSHLEGVVLRRRAPHDTLWCRLREAVDDARRAVDLLRSAGDYWNMVDAQGTASFGLMCAGRPEEATASAEEGERDARRIGHPVGLGICWLVRGWLELWSHGDLAGAAGWSDSVVGLAEAQAPSLIWGARAFRFSVLFVQGRWDEAKAEGLRAVEQEGMTAGTSGMASGALALLAAYSGASEESHAIVARYGPDILADRGPLGTGPASMLIHGVETLAILGRRDEAAAFYERASDLAGAGFVAGPITAIGLLQITLGIAAGCGQQWERAAEHFEKALRQAHELPNRIAQPEARRWYAWMLLERDGPGDRAKARELLAEAIAMYRELGMPKHLEIAEALIVQARGA